MRSRHDVKLFMRYSDTRREYIEPSQTRICPDSDFFSFMSLHIGRNGGTFRADEFDQQPPVVSALLAVHESLA